MKLSRDMCMCEISFLNFHSFVSRTAMAKKNAWRARVIRAVESFFGKCSDKRSRRLFPTFVCVKGILVCGNSSVAGRRTSLRQRPRISWKLDRQALASSNSDARTTSCSIR